mmetsp:Transcript_26763/g.52746  ORF Transcript_26763/g.52746 Transcript_26763/m.52746 type:complete len:230 (-) Transcript_26763:1896-2585(-)
MKPSARNKHHIPAPLHAAQGGACLKILYFTNFCRNTRLTVFLIVLLLVTQPRALFVQKLLDRLGHRCGPTCVSRRPKEPPAQTICKHVSRGCSRTRGKTAPRGAKLQLHRRRDCGLASCLGHAQHRGRSREVAAKAGFGIQLLQGLQTCTQVHWNRVARRRYKLSQRGNTWLLVSELLKPTRYLLYWHLQVAVPLQNIIFGEVCLCVCVGRSAPKHCGEVAGIHVPSHV